MVGNASNTPKKSLQYKTELQRHLPNAILPQEGVDVFRRIIARVTTPQVIVSTSDILVRIRRAEDYLHPERQAQGIGQAQGTVPMGDGRQAQGAVHTQVGGQVQGTVATRGGGQAVPMWRGAQTQGSVPMVSYQRPNLRSDYVPPQNETQQQIATLCQELLGIEKVGIHDHFLALGGNSLVATQMITRLHDIFHVDITLDTLLQETTIEQLALLIVQKMADRVSDEQLLQAIENAERLTDDEVQTFLAADMN